MLDRNDKPRLVDFIQSFQEYDKKNYSQSVNNISAATGKDWLDRYNQIETKGQELTIRYWWNRLHLISNNAKHGSTIEYMLRSHDFWVKVYSDIIEVLLDLENIP